MKSYQKKNFIHITPIIMKTNLRSHYYQPHFIDFLNSLCPFRRQKPHQKCEQGKCNKKNNYVILKSSYVQRETKEQQEERNDRCEGQLTTSSSETDSPREASFWMRAPPPHIQKMSFRLYWRGCVTGTHWKVEKFAGIL